MAILGPGLYDPKNFDSSQKYSFGKSDRHVFNKRDEGNFRFYINPEPVA